LAEQIEKVHQALSELNEAKAGIMLSHPTKDDFLSEIDPNPGVMVSSPLTTKDGIRWALKGFLRRVSNCLAPG
jgi:hypothetical protein